MSLPFLSLQPENRPSNRNQSWGNYTFKCSWKKRVIYMWYLQWLICFKTICSSFTGHETEKPQTCTICGNRFTPMESIHFRVHEKEKPYICSICRGSFALKFVFQGFMEGKSHISTAFVEAILLSSWFLMFFQIV